MKKPRSARVRRRVVPSRTQVLDAGHGFALGEEGGVGELEQAAADGVIGFDDAGVVAELAVGVLDESEKWPRLDLGLGFDANAVELAVQRRSSAAIFGSGHLAAGLVHGTPANFPTQPRQCTRWRVIDRGGGLMHGEWPVDLKFAVQPGFRGLCERADSVETRVGVKLGEL